MRKFKFTNGEFYHIYNRGVDKRDIFLNGFDFARFLQGMDEFNSVRPIGSIFENSFRLRSRTPKSPKLVDIVCFCLNKNHYHLVLRQVSKNGVTEFMRRLGTGFTNFFNSKNHRSGVLFQGKFKAKHITSNEYLLHVSSYVNLNNKVHKINDSQKFLSSWNEYIDNEKGGLCKKDIILDQFDNIKEYKEFAINSLNSILEKKKLYKELEQFLIAE